MDREQPSQLDKMLLIGLNLGEHRGIKGSHDPFSRKTQWPVFAIPAGLPSANHPWDVGPAPNPGQDGACERIQYVTVCAGDRTNTLRFAARQVPDDDAL
jgi:hypothetical protein